MRASNLYVCEVKRTQVSVISQNLIKEIKKEEEISRGRKGLCEEGWREVN